MRQGVTIPAQPMPEQVARTVAERASGTCEALIPGVCIGEAQHLHHRQLRSQGGKHQVSNIVHICHACHHWVHLHPKQAYRTGFLVHGWDEPEDEPVRRHQTTNVLLHEDGTMTRIED